MNLSQLCAASLLLTVLLPAQTQTAISPKASASAGNTNNNIPYSWFPTRYMQVYDYDSFTTGTTTPIIANEVDYRMNSSFANGNYGGQTVELTMWLGLAAKGISSTNTDNTFDNNIDQATKKLVLSKTKVNMPKLANTSFGIVIKFDQPSFTFVPSLQRSLVLEVIKWDSTRFTYPLDAGSGTNGVGCKRLYAYESTPGGGSYVQNGNFTGCPNAANQNPTHYASAGDLKIGGTSGYLYANSYVPNAPGLMILGATKFGNTGIPLGNGCNLMQDIILLVTGVAASSTTGRMQVTLPIPNDKKLAGVKFLTQFFFVEQGANPLNLFATRGLEVTIGDGIGTTPDKYTQITGSSTSYGLVTQFQ